MVAKESIIIIGDIYSRSRILKYLLKEFEERKILILDSIGVLSSLNFEKIKNEKINLKEVLSDRLALFEAISEVLQLSRHEKMHVRSAIEKAERMRIANILEKLASTSNPFIHSPSEVILIEGLINELNELTELDEFISEESFALYFDDLEENEVIVFDISNLRSSKSKKLLSILILHNLTMIKNRFVDLLLISEGPEGYTLAESISEDYLFLLIDKLMLNDISCCFTSSLKRDFIRRFNRIYLSEEGKLIEFKKDFDLKKIDEIYFFEKIFERKEGQKRKSILEILYGEMSDLIAELVLSMENNLLSRKEFKNLAISLGYFKESDDLLEKLISENIIEERIVGGLKKYTATSKGLFLAKAHKMK